MLRRWRARQAEEKLFVGAGYEDRDFVFCHPDGRPYEPDRFSREFLTGPRLVAHLICPPLHGPAL